MLLATTLQSHTEAMPGLPSLGEKRWAHPLPLATIPPGAWHRYCLVPRPQYYVSVIRFGSRGPGQKVWPRQKSKKWDNLSHFFTVPISSRGREFSEHFWERDRKRKALKAPRFWLMLIGQVKRPIWIQTDIYRVRSIAAFNWTTVYRNILITRNIFKCFE